MKKYQQWLLAAMVLAGLVNLTSSASILSTKITYSSATCHPQVNSAAPQYLIGYGSLMQTASKNKTNPNTGPDIPVLVTGYERGWFVKGAAIGFSTTFLGVIADSAQKFNGVIFCLPAATIITQYDAREIFLCRRQVATKQIQILTHKPLPQGQYWIYVAMPHFMAKPSKTYPIVQSYVDIFISGCLQIQNEYHLKNYAAECIATTHAWSLHWVNDRIYPRRAFAEQPQAAAIDKLLANQLPQFFKAIKIE